MRQWLQSWHYDNSRFSVKSSSPHARCSIIILFIIGAWITQWRQRKDHAYIITLCLIPWLCTSIGTEYESGLRARGPHAKTGPDNFAVTRVEKAPVARAVWGKYTCDKTERLYMFSGGQCWEWITQYPIILASYYNSYEDWVPLYEIYRDLTHWYREDLNKISNKWNFQSFYWLRF